MKENLFNPYLIFALGTVVGFAMNYAFKIFVPDPIDSDDICDEDFTAAKRKIISVERAKEIYDSYTTRRVPLIENFEIEGFKPTRFGHVSFSTLKNYVDYLSCIEKKMGREIASVRIYFANYPEKFANGDSMLGKVANGDTYTYEKRNTFFLLPTILDNQEESGFVINEENEALTYESIENFRRNKSSQKRTDESYSLIFNEVGLTPPPPTISDDFHTP